MEIRPQRFAGNLLTHRDCELIHRREVDLIAYR